MSRKPNDYGFAVQQQDARELTVALLELMHKRGETKAAALLAAVELTAVLVADLADDRAHAEKVAVGCGHSLRAHLDGMVRR